MMSTPYALAPSPRRLLGAVLLLLSAACGDDSAAGTDVASPAGSGPGPTPPSLFGAGGAGSPFAPPSPPPAVHLSEIMYHAVLEVGFDEPHEFVELHNASGAAVSLDGWRLEGGVTHVFGPRAIIAPGGFLVVASQAAALTAEYGLDPALVAGEYAGELGNDGEAITLLDAAGRRVESVEYDDAFPWPVGADALGAGESWLAPALRPLASHAHRGRSLERVSYQADAARASSWRASALDAATPGAPNGAARAEPLPIVESLTFAPAATGSVGSPIGAGDEVQVRVGFSEHGALSGAVLEYHPDPLTGADGAKRRADLLDDGLAADAAAGDRSMVATLPAFDARTVVRVRVLADRGAGEEVISPRPSDPMTHHAYYVSEPISSGVRVYELFIDPAQWTSLWENIQDGRVTGCDLAPGWNLRVPGLFVHGSFVQDVQLRYQGSRWNRTNGEELSSWPHPGPSAPSPLRALSIRVAFPRYARFEGMKAFSLNKLTQGCPGLSARVGFGLFEDVGLAVPRTRYAHVEINGGYYHFALEIERPGEAMLERYHRAQALRTGAAEPEPVGHLFKSVGCTCDEGPFGWGDGRLLEEHCGYGVEERYAATYDRKTHEWADHGELIGLIEDLHVAREQGPAALESFLRERFDVELMLSYLAVINWSVPFDDMFQNHFLYQRRSDGRWLFLPWDLDQDFGGWKGADASLFIGEEGDRDNRSGWFSYFKDAFIKTFRVELVERMQTLGQGPLSPEAVGARVDAVMGEIDLAEAEAAPAGTACDFEAQAEAFRRFATERHEVVLAQ